MMTEKTRPLDSSTLVACSLGEDDLRQRQKVARELFALAQKVEELPDGYAWRFPGEGDWQARLLDFIAAERSCCGFFRIELVFEPGLGPVLLSLRGPDGTKAFIAETFAAQ
jgi:hypothetical protein